MRNFAVDMTENLIDCMHKKWWFAKQEILSSLCHTHKGVKTVAIFLNLILRRNRNNMQNRFFRLSGAQIRLIEEKISV